MPWFFCLLIGMFFLLYSSSPIYLFATEGEYIEHHNDTFRNMFYLKEEERGFYPEENLLVPGRFEINFKPRESKEITFVASLEHNADIVNADEVFEIVSQAIEVCKANGYKDLENLFKAYLFLNRHL